MLFFIGAFFVLIGIYLFFTYIRNSRRPRIQDARILETTMEPYKFAPNNSQRKFPHALVEYYYESIKYQQKILLHSKSKPGDTVQLFVDSTRPEDVEEYYPFKQILICVVITLIGIGTMITSLLLFRLLGNWSAEH